MRLFVVLGPSQSGKTTLIDAMAGLDGQPVRHAENDDPLTTVSFTYLGEPWVGIDIAGGPENLGFAGQALGGADAAVICVPADADAAVLAAPYIRLVEDAGTPCLLFINRMDEAKGRVRDIASALQGFARHALVLRQVPIRDGEKVVGAVDLISERAWEYQEGQPSQLVELPQAALDREQEARTELLEHLADFDDHLLEELIEDKAPPTEELFSITRKVLAENKVMPVFLGAASHMNGVNRLMKALRHEAPGVEVTRERVTGGEPALAVGLHGAMRRHVGKTVMIRALDEGVAAGKPLAGATLSSMTALDGKTAIDRLAPGEIGLAVKSDHLNPGHLFDAESARPLPAWSRGHPPSLARVLVPESEKDDARLSAALTRLAEIEPGLELGTDEATGHTVVRLQGPMHLRRVLAMLQNEFGVKVREEPVGASYRETISRPVTKHYRHRKQSGGAGQFADVVMEIRPAPRGAGFSFDEVVKGGAVPRNYIPAVEQGARDALAEGPLGFPVIDLSVTLTDGKSHSVDSSDFAFRTAGRMGVKEALAEAGPVLLQPIDRVTFHIPSQFSGALVQLVSSLKGQVLGFDANPEAPGWDIFKALIPAAAHDEIDRALGGATQGTGWYEAEFDHYEELHGREAEAVTRARAEAHA